MLAEDQQLEEKMEQKAVENVSLTEEEAAAKEAEKLAEGQKNQEMLLAIPKNIKGLAQVRSKTQAQVEVEAPSPQTMLELSTEVAQSATKGDKEEFTMLQMED